MSLRTVVAAPFQQRGARQLSENAFVVSLSLDRDWFSPEQATRVGDIAVGQGLLERETESLRITFDPESVDIPASFTPDPALLQTADPFEQVLDVVDEAGIEKHEAVAAINRLQADLAVTVEAAAVLYGRRQGLEVAEIAREARSNL